MTRIFAIALILAACVVAPASAGNWNVDYAKSRLGFTVQWSNQPFVATFRMWKADITFDPADLAHAKADVTIALASEDSGDKDFDGSIVGGLGFQSVQFPIAHFLATSFSHKSGNDYVATGSLTIRGITRPATLPFTLVISGKTAHMTGTAQVIRTDYGVGQGEWAGESPVAHVVTVNIDLVATRF